MKVTIRTSGFLSEVRTIADASVAVHGVVVYFRNALDAGEFASRLPKYVKAKTHNLTCGFGKNPNKSYGLVWRDGQAIGVSLGPIPLNESTGAVNEMGEKRRAAFVAALKNCEVVADLNV